MAPVIGPQGQCISFDNPVYNILEMVFGARFTKFESL